MEEKRDVGMEQVGGFLAALPEELRNDADLAKFADVVELAREYVRARGEMARLKAEVPRRPAGVEEYDLPLPAEGADEGLVNGFKALAFEVGLSLEQARGIADFWNRFVEARTREEQDGQMKALEGLRGEWGKEFERRVKGAAKAAARFGGDGFRRYLDETGMGNNAHFIRAFHAIAQAISEDSYQGGGTGPAPVRRGPGGMPLLRFRSMEGGKG